MRTITLLAVASVVLAPAVVSAQWTLPRGDLAFVGSYSYQVATTEFFDEGGERNFPLEGRYSGSTYTLAVRAGFTDQIELELAIPIRQVSFVADPVILPVRDPMNLPADSAEEERMFYRDAIFDFNSTQLGIGDLYLSGRYRWILEPIATATEVRIKTPTGYDGPQGTFNEAGPGSQNIRDDVTLGDAQLDITASQIFGISLPSRTFARLDLGYVLRLGGGGDQLTGSFRVGQLFLDRFLVYLGARIDYAIQQGRSIGVSFRARDPNLAANLYDADRDLVPTPLFLDRDALDVSGGLIYKITDTVEINVGYSRTVWGRNTAATNNLSIGFAVRTSTEDDEEEIVEEEVVEEPVVEEPLPEPAPPTETMPMDPAADPATQPDA